MNLIEATLNAYAREARQLYIRLFTEPFDKSGRGSCELYLRLLTRYEFLAQMFEDFNWFGWRDTDFDITEAMK